MAKKYITQIRLDENLYNLVKSISEDEMRSLNAQMEYFIKNGAERYLIERDHFLDKLGGEEAKKEIDKK